MNSGLMDRLIQVHTPSYSDSAYGKANKPASWATAKSIWGRVQYNGGNESVAADKKEFQETITVTFHYADASDLTQVQRLFLDSKYWNITSRSEINRRQYVRVEAVATQ